MSVSFDNAPIAYYLIGDLLIILAGGLAFAPFFKPQLTQQKTFIWGYLSLMVFIMVMMRMPIIVYNHELNPDESWMIVGAMTLAKDPVFWKSVDGGTSGPLNFYILVLFNELFSQPYDYISARMVGILLMAGSAILFFFTVCRLFKPYIAFICLFPIATFLGVTRNTDFIHYSSEHVSIFLISLLCFIYACIYEEGKPRYFILFAQGFLAILTIFAKLQATPAALCCLGLTLWMLFQKIYFKSPKQFYKYAFVLVSGGFVFLSIFFSLAVYLEVFDEIIDFYFTTNLKYSETSGSFFNVKFFYESLFYDFNFVIRIIAVMFVAWFLVQVFYQRHFKPHLPTLLMIGLLFSSIFAVYKTGFLFQHYFLFLVFPSGFLLAALILSSENLMPKPFLKIALGGVIAFAIVQNTISPVCNEYVTAGKPQRPMPLSDVSLVVMKFAKENESIVVWGGAGYYYLETQHSQGVRWNNTLWGLYSQTARDFLHRHYVNGLRTAAVPVFIDSYKLGASFMQRDIAGHETVKDLKALIKENYVLAAEVNEQRIYVRKDLCLTQNCKTLAQD